MTKYTYEVRGFSHTWSVLARGPRGGTRRIGDYATRYIAERVAKVLAEAGSDSRSLWNA